MVLFKNNGKGIEVEAQEYSEIILLGGQPLNEPVACYGPFVMNRFPELQQAIMDYEAGKMGDVKIKESA
jgi:redox-sensitive bicupin YhaK (pirin superfamily)